MMPDSQHSAAEPLVYTHDLWGQPTDFAIAVRREGDRNVITVTTVMPALQRDGNHLRSFSPPRYPWPAAAAS